MNNKPIDLAAERHKRRRTGPVFPPGQAMTFQIIAPCPEGAHIYVGGSKVCECGKTSR